MTLRRFNKVIAISTIVLTFVVLLLIPAYTPSRTMTWQKKIINTVHKYHGKVEVNKNGYITSITINNETFDDRGLLLMCPHAVYYPFLESLDLRGTNISKESLELIFLMPALRKLGLPPTIDFDDPSYKKITEKNVVILKNL